MRITVATARLRRAGIGAVALLAGWFAASAIDGAAARGGVPALAATAPAVTALVVAAVPSPAAPPAVPAATAPAPAEASDLLGRFRMTRYYVANEARFGRPAREPADEAEGGDPVLAAAAPGVPIFDDRGCRRIATVTRRFRQVLDVQGTGKLRDGRVVNVSKPCRCGHSPCYRAMRRDVRWGMSATMKPLQPFRMVAVDPKVVPLGSLLYVEELDGLTMPGQAPWGGFVHDGCVLAADVGGGIDGKHIDFFVGRFAYKKALDARGRIERVTIYRGEGRCTNEGGRVARKARI